MKSVLFASSLMFALGGTPSKLYVDDEATLETMWSQFKEDYKRKYDEKEERKRFHIFVDNLKRIDERNAIETGTATFGINMFADISKDEFEENYLNSNVEKMLQQRNSTAANHRIVDSVPKYEGTESFVDWTGIYTTPVKDQGYCGSCWAFSATEQIESDAMRQLGSKYVLSVNQMLQCTGAGAVPCRGGLTEYGYDYVTLEGGLETEEDYPYEDPHLADCKSVARKEVVGCRSYTTVYGEENMAAYVKGVGPLSVCLSATGWEYYTGGIMEKCPNYVNHCVQAVGVDDSAEGGYWKVRNSYGSHWGEGGYIRLAYGQNTCFITRDPTYTETHYVNN